MTGDGPAWTPDAELRLYVEGSPFTPGWHRWDPEPGECVNCGKVGTDFAHGVYEGVAVMFGEVLRKAFAAHLEEHGCADPERGGRGYGHCPEAMRLEDLLPDQMVAIG